jgi:type 2 lantibiotic biosynthesis protein LanM
MILRQVTRACVIELNVARMHHRLQGNTPEARYRSFVFETFADPALARQMLSGYPVLVRDIMTITRNLTDAWTEMLDRLIVDSDSIAACFGIAPQDSLRDVSFGMGDSHDRGRSVMILTFSPEVRIVYKPRPHGMDVHFQELIAWANARGLDPELRSISILDRGTHGWSEFVTADPCEHSADVALFFRRVGALLCILHMLDATDIHLENLIASRSDPVLVDCETLFHNTLRKDDRIADLSIVRREAALAATVLNTGLLPQRIAGEQGVMDLSGLLGHGGQVNAFSVPAPAMAGTDEMHIAQSQVRLGETDNLPKINGKAMTVLDHRQDFLAGYRDTYRLMMALRDELLAEDGPIAAFSGDLSRFVPHPTFHYASLLSQACHPSVLRDAVERDMLFDRLLTLAPDRPQLERILESEVDDLWECDVPVFRKRVGSADLEDSRGRTYPGFFRETSLARVQARIARMGSADLQRQTYAIEASLASSRLGASSIMPTGRGPARTHAPRNAFIDAAAHIGDRLLDLAIPSGHEAHWLGLIPISADDFSCAPVPADLYSGAAGIAIFLSELGRKTGRKKYDLLARKAFRAVRSQMRTRQPWGAAGGFNGLTSLFYAAAHSERFEPKLGLRKAVLAELPKVGPLITDDRQFDLMGGSAGAAIVLLRLHSILAEPALLRMAERAGDHLLASAEPMPVGLAWATMADSPPLLGLSHGAAGIGWALAELATATGRVDFSRAATEAFRWEASVFDGTNWPDLRTNHSTTTVSDSQKHAWAWCHGSVGAGLARVLAAPHLPEYSAFAREIDAAVETTLAQGFGGTHCLCHGDLGNAEFLLLASEYRGDPNLAEKARGFAAAVLDDVTFGSGPQCGVAEGFEMPGFMAGIAGIGYQFLRIADPDDTPSILALSAGRNDPHP